MSDAPQVVVAAHGIAVLGEGVFVGIAVVLFDQDAARDAPAVAPSQITALMHIVAIERSARDPGVFGVEVLVRLCAFSSSACHCSWQTTRWTVR